MKNRFIYIITIAFMLGLAGCHSSKRATGGEVKTEAKHITRKQKATMPVDNTQGYVTLQQLRMMEYRIMWYKEKRKEAKKNKEYDKMAIYDMNLKRYQRLRRQMTTLYVRIIRNLNSDF